MPALNFQKRFADAVERGEKRQTIRAHRRDGRAPAWPGSYVKLYTGMRTKSCRLLAERLCTDVLPIFISAESRTIWRSRNTRGTWHYRHALMTPSEVAAIIADDGFDDPLEFWKFFDRGDGRFWLIKWSAESSENTTDQPAEGPAGDTEATERP